MISNRYTERPGDLHGEPVRAGRRSRFRAAAAIASAVAIAGLAACSSGSSSSSWLWLCLLIGRRHMSRGVGQHLHSRTLG